MAPLNEQTNERRKEIKKFVYSNVLLGNKDDNYNSRPAARNWRHTMMSNSHANKRFNI